MKRLKILTWHIHGSYLNSLAHIEHDWYVPLKPGRPDRYIGRGATFDGHENLHEVPADEVRKLDLDLILFQTLQNYQEDQYEILSERQLQLPKIYLEHNTPRPHASDTHHPVDDPRILLVHVTHYNRLMWDNGRTPTTVIEHSVAIDPTASYQGNLEKGITVVNTMRGRGRIVGYDIFQQARESVPLDLAGMQSAEIGGLGDIPYRHLHKTIAQYRFLFSPMRYTSLPLAVIEGLTLGMPIVALATTELPTVIENGKQGYLSCNIDELIEHMRFLLAHPAEARRMGEQARKLAQERFSMPRFIHDWNEAFAAVTSQ
ncbi:MAG TPA: glycosyltransferase [Ktedonobacteraceae bacterium]|nr:glycosyltransferase [Ktedonobacteraceae bacterium]